MSVSKGPVRVYPFFVPMPPIILIHLYATDDDDDDDDDDDRRVACLLERIHQSSTKANPVRCDAMRRGV